LRRRLRLPRILSEKEREKTMRKSEIWKARKKTPLQPFALGLGLAILMLFGGCAKNTTVNDFCMIYNPIFPDYEADSAETIRQIDWNNVVFEELCR
jgi:hypothetical protein